MPIIKNTSQGIMLGVICPEPLYTYITLYTLAKGNTKTDIVLDQLQMWKDMQLAEKSELMLLKEVSARILIEWQKESLLGKITIRDFKIAITKELKRKNLPDAQIREILKDIK